MTKVWILVIMLSSGEHTYARHFETSRDCSHFGGYFMSGYREYYGEEVDVDYECRVTTLDQFTQSRGIPQ
jgi:hypothetical protein